MVYCKTSLKTKWGYTRSFLTTCFDLDSNHYTKATHNNYVGLFVCNLSPPEQMDQIGNLIVSFIIVRWYFLAQKFRIQDPVFWQSRISMITLFFNFSVNKTFRSMFIWRSCPATVTANIKIQQLLQLIIINVIFRITYVYLEFMSSYCDS